MISHHDGCGYGTYWTSRRQLRSSWVFSSIYDQFTILFCGHCFWSCTYRRLGFSIGCTHEAQACCSTLSEEVKRRANFYGISYSSGCLTISTGDSVTHTHSSMNYSGLRSHRLRYLLWNRYTKTSGISGCYPTSPIYQMKSGKTYWRWSISSVIICYGDGYREDYSIFSR